MRLIDGDALIERFEPKQAYFTEAIVSKIKSQPAVDAIDVNFALQRVEGAVLVALEMLNEMNLDGRLYYDDYCELHDAISEICYTGREDGDADA